jgi:high-affinity iron transporter
MSGSLGAAALNIGVLVFREGLECILVLAAITASMTGASRRYRWPVGVGAAMGFVATMGTWVIAVRALDALSDNVSALQLQAATGLVAVAVLLVVMNWFFHKVYWTGWISLHTTAKQALLAAGAAEPTPGRRILLGLGFLGFTSLYREGVEVVLFLQTYRLQFGGAPIGIGVSAALIATAVVGVLTFWLRRRLPYRRMLVLTGVLLGVVLLVMVGEQAQEMQLARWLPTSTLPRLARHLPDWAGVWFSIFPTWETLGAQLIAAALVVGSYLVARRHEAGRAAVA